MSDGFEIVEFEEDDLAPEGDPSSDCTGEHPEEEGEDG